MYVIANDFVLHLTEICTAGNFRNGSNVCVPCPVGQYQSEDLKDDCDKCSNSYTTDGDGKTHKDNCTCK